MGVDYISLLPDEVLHHILSFLTNAHRGHSYDKEIACISVLSKRWYEVWKNLPFLEFDFFVLFSQIGCDESKLPQLCDCVEQILFRRSQQSLKYNKFSLIARSLCWKGYDFIGHMNRWIEYAIDAGVQEFKVCVGPFVKDEIFKYVVPHSLFQTKTIRVLDLEGCKLYFFPSDHKLELPLLKKLCMTNIFTDDNVVGEFLSHCPLIEDLRLEECYGIKNLTVRNLVKLEKMRLYALEDLECLKMDLPNLNDLNWEGVYWPSQVNFFSCKNLKRLSLRDAAIEDRWLHQLLSALSLLQRLSLSFCNGLEKIRILSSHLHELVIYNCEKLVGIEIHAPSLVKFSYNGTIISISFGDSVVPKFVILHLKSNNNIDNDWYVKLLELLSKFINCCQVLHLSCRTGDTYQCPILPREIRQKLRPPLRMIKEVHLYTKSYPIAEAVDTMLWIAPHAKSLSIKPYMVRTKIEFQFLYKHQSGENKCCWEDFPVRCWRNCINYIQLKKINYDHKGRRLGENIKIIEKNVWKNVEDYFKIDSGL